MSLQDKQNQVIKNIQYKCPEVSLKLSGKLKALYVINKDGSVAQKYENIPNLITNAGKDRILGNLPGIASCLDFFHLGTSNTAVSASDTGLGAWVKSTSSLFVADSTTTGTTWNALTGTIVLRQTRDFSAETGAITYREFAVGYGSANNQTINRLLLPSDLNLTADQQVRATFDLTVTLSPYTVSSTNPTITGWTTTGENRIDTLFGQGDTLTNFGFPFEYIKSDGSKTGFVSLGGFSRDAGGILPQLFDADTAGPTTNPTLAPLYNTTNTARQKYGLALFTSAVGAWNTFGELMTLPSVQTLTNCTSTFKTYTNGNYYRDIEVVVPPNASGTNFSVHGFKFNGLLVKFNTPQTKATTHRLVINGRISIS